VNAHVGRHELIDVLEHAVVCVGQADVGERASELEDAEVTRARALDEQLLLPVGGDARNAHGEAVTHGDTAERLAGALRWGDAAGPLRAGDGLDTLDRHPGVREVPGGVGEDAVAPVARPAVGLDPRLRRQVWVALVQAQDEREAVGRDLHDIALGVGQRVVVDAEAADGDALAAVEEEHAGGRMREKRGAVAV